MPRNLKELPLDELESTGEPTSRDYYKVETELKRRQTKAQIEAADASKETADYAKQSVRWMFWSVVVLAAASVASFVLDLLAFLRLPSGG